ncbi:hypothetical protein HD806DRAFT_327250 [Xylariaceae sp. AK1471]|nr:hypothetical protein HD806DRAFT_327250 [Xylariaceae sp. AK1471]
MAPRGPAVRRQTQSQNEHLFALGKVGRKTGLTIPDTGRRDEHGLELLDDLFSSPEKDLPNGTNGRTLESPEDQSNEQDEQDMEIDDGSELGPATTRKLQQGRISLPRVRSPIKTHLKSPARQNPHLAPSSSPVRGTVVTARERSPDQVVARRLDFSKSSQQLKRPLVNGHGTATAIKGRNGKPTKDHSPVQEAIVSDETEEEDEEDEDEPLELLDGGVIEQDDPPEEAEQEEMEEELSLVQEPEPKPKPINKPKPPGRRGRKPKVTAEEEDTGPADASLVGVSTEENEVDEEPVKRRKGRRPKTVARQEEKEPTPVADHTPLKSSKRGRPARTSTDDVEESSADSRGAKRHKTSAKPDIAEKDTLSKPVPAKEKGKPGRKRKSSGIGVNSPMIQRGPPLPRSRGLVTLRREDTTAMRTTRSGRASFRPLEWWKGEHVEYDEEQEKIFTDSGNRHFKMPTVKGVVRTEESHEEAAHKRRGRPPTGRKPSRRPSAVPEEEEIEREEWEDNPGRVTGEVICWEPEHEFEPPAEEDEVEVVPDELAISENAIQLKDIKDATFKFAKTLTLPFFGSGIVDLPPGAEKRPKNSRKMHLVFFVHTGNVQVTIAQTEFGIAKGGMFFVPRGNHYSIRNETDRHARIFFAQGCEVFVQPELEE